MNDDLSGFSMLELFRLEAESQAEILSAGVLAIEEQRQSAETIESLMRAAHSLKGAARIVASMPLFKLLTHLRMYSSQLATTKYTYSLHTLTSYSQESIFFHL